MRRIPSIGLTRQTRLVRGAAPAPHWTPLALSPLVWLKQGALVYSDAGTTPAVDTDPVYRWGDSSGNGRNADQTTLGNRPVYNTNSGNPYLNFDGSNDYLNLGNAAALNLTAGGTIFFRAQFNATSGDGWIVGRDDASLGRSYCFGNSGGGLQLQINGSNQLGGIGILADMLYRVGLTGNASVGWKVFLDGVSVAAPAWSAPSSSTAPTNVGRRSYATAEGYANCRLFDVLMFGSALSDEDYALLDGYFAAI